MSNQWKSIPIAADPYPQASTSGQPGDARLTSFATDGEGKDVEEWDYLNNFFKKFNKALLDKAAVDRERARLEQVRSPSGFDSYCIRM